MKIDIHILCYNESHMIGATIHHYKTRFPSATIHIHDNYSTDTSVDVATSMGCRVAYFGYKDGADEYAMTALKNNVWKQPDAEWVLVCDADEWLCMDEEQLRYEESRGATILLTDGFNMVAESQRADASDIVLKDITKGVYCGHFSKNVLFDARKITEINYNHGCHHCNPVGTPVVGSRSYVLKHQNYLGAEYIVAKRHRLYQRYSRMREMYPNSNLLCVLQDDQVYRDEHAHQLKHALEVDETRSACGLFSVWIVPVWFS